MSTTTWPFGQADEIAKAVLLGLASL